MKRDWFGRKDRIQYELELLDEAGIKYEAPSEIPDSGVYEIRVDTSLDGEAIPLVVSYPDLFPYFRFEVAAPTLSLDHHQNPFEKNLCLLGRDTANWLPSDTLLDFIRERLPRVILTGRSGDREDVRGREEEQAEPISEYYPYRDDTIVLIDGSWAVPADLRSGKLILGSIGPLRPVLRVIVLELEGPDGSTLFEIDPSLRDLCSDIFSARWIRREDPLLESNATRAFEIVSADFSSSKPPHSTKLADDPDQARLAVYGVLFPEEVSWRTEGDGWTFVVELSRKEDVPDETRRKGTRRQRVSHHYFARPGRAGRDDLLQRVPEIKSLSTKKVSVFGLGCIGAPSALEFARNCLGELSMVDFDYLDPASIVRWPRGMVHSGLGKSRIINSTVRTEFPYTKIDPIRGKLGAHSIDNLELIERMVKDTNLVFDATAELGVQYFLSDLAKELGVPYVGISSTEGGWGGRVVRIVPGKTEGCLWCLFKHFDDETILPPPSAPSGTVQTAGCGNPTFTGASFDVTQVSLTGVRLAVATLCGHGDDGYPDFDWDAAILHLRQEDGTPILPRWESSKLSVHPGCPRCQTHASSG